MFSAWGSIMKKAPNLYGMGLSACFVTPEIEKSNFYKDLERLSEWEFQGKPKAKEKV